MKSWTLSRISTLISKKYSIFLLLLSLSSCASSGSNEKNITVKKPIPTPTSIPSSPQYDANKLINDRYRQQRAQYARSQHQTLTQRRTGNSAHYPLSIYPEYRQLESTTYLNATQVKSFLNRERNTYVAYKVRERWLKQLMQEGRYSQLIKDYNPNNASDQTRCNYLLSLNYTDKKRQAFSKFKQLWLNGDSLPNNCDELIDQWRYSPYYSDTLVWERIHLALAKNKPRIAQHIVNMMTQKQQQLATSYLDTYQHPSLLASNLNRFSRHPQGSAIIAISLQQLAKEDPRQAAQIYNRQIAKFNSSQKVAISKAISQGVDKQFRPLLSVQNWNAVYQLLSVLPKSEQQKPKWSYWLARSLEQQGKPQQAKSFYRQAASERDFYAYLAADKIKAPYQLNHRDNPVSQAKVIAMAKRAGIQRAIEFYRLQQYTQARREWNHATRDFKTDDWLAAAQVAHLCGWHQQAIFTIAKAAFWDDTNIRFPTVYEQQIQSAAVFEGIDSNWVYGITRQESAFGNTAVSSAGAQGLMQLMPATARITARSMGVPYDRYQLNNSTYNIQLGSHYLAKMYHRYNANRVLASAAYNAGPGRVSRWLKDGYQQIPADIWIENIPFKETRKYVKNVLMYNIIYARKRNQTVSILEPQERIISAQY